MHRLPLVRLAARVGGLLVAAALCMGGCTQTPKPAAGLELIIVADGLSAPADFDDIQLQVSQQSDGGSWNEIWNRDYEVPSPEATLPTTFAVVAGQSADQEVLIVLTAFKGGRYGQPVVQRVAQVQAPTDRVAALWLVLAEVCRGQVTVVGAEGEPMSTCPSGQSCQPSTGGCGTSVVSDPSSLPTYVPGENLDAALPGLVVALAVSAEAGGGGADGTTTTAADAAGAAGARDASLSADSGPDAPGSAGSDGEAGGADAMTTLDTGSDVAETGASSASATSCQTTGPGLTNCGASSESCCTSLPVTGGMYYRTYDEPIDLAPDGGPTLSADGGPTGFADPAMVSSFRLDKYLVTVGRFRQFVTAWNGGGGYTPPAGSGKHTHLNGGSGLNATGGGYDPGWVTTDNANIAPTNANLACDPPLQTWTNTTGTQETLPINCVNWYVAYAFCIWDGGFLPSEAEWEYAAAGGSQQREYPWGSTDPGTSNEYAILDNQLGEYTTIEPVGTATLGAGLWGQLDLVGEVYEWNLDLYAAYTDPCTDCAATDTTAGSGRVFRGGNTTGTDYVLFPPYRGAISPTIRNPYLGVRCARTP